MTRFNIRNFSRRLKRELSLTPLLAGFLAACGNGSTTSDFFISPTPPTDGDGNTGDFDILVTDGPVWGATVYVDENDDGQYNVGEEELGVTIYYNGESSNQQGDEVAIVLSPLTTVFSIRKQRNDALPVAEQLSDAELLQRVLGPDTDVEVPDIFDPAFYTWDGTSGAAGSEADRTQEVTERAIQLQQAANTDHGGDLIDLVDQLIDDEEGGSFDLTETSQAAR